MDVYKKYFADDTVNGPTANWAIHSYAIYVTLFVFRTQYDAPQK
jgi:hypothetical protein